MRFIRELTELFFGRKGRSRRQKVLAAMMAFVVFCTTYALILPAITLDIKTAETEPGVEAEQAAEETLGEVQGESYLSAGQQAADEEQSVDTAVESISEETAEITGTDADTDAATEKETDPETAIETEETAGETDPETAETEAVYAESPLKWHSDAFDVEIRFESDQWQLPEDTVLEVKTLDKKNEKDKEDYEYYDERARKELKDSDEELEKDAYVCSFYQLTLKSDGSEIGVPEGAADITIKYNLDDESIYKKAKVLKEDEKLLASLFQNDEDETLLFDENWDESEVISLKDHRISKIHIKDLELSDYENVIGLYACPQAEKALTLEAEGDDYTVTAECGEKSGVPEGAELAVEEIKAGSEAFDQYMEAAREAMGKASAETVPAEYARFFDIKIMVEGEEYEPETQVDVKISFHDPVMVEKMQDVSAVHFGEEETQVLDTEKKESKDGVENVSFAADSFSVYGVVYTVDFKWEVNGKTYEYSLPGGGAISLEALAEIFGLAEKADKTEDTGAFIADIAKAEFSDPDLVWVGKAEEEATVADLKEANKLEVEYSDELTEEQIGEINAQTVKEGDWVLISMRPFESQESLTVTMKTGEVFTIKVTDAQIKKTFITAKGETYEITVTYGEDAGIPDGAELKVEEILEENKEYSSYYENSIKTIYDEETDTENSTDLSGETKKSLVSRLKETFGGEKKETMETEDTEETIDYVRIFDIEIWHKGQKIEPKSEVAVNIKLLDAPEEENQTPEVVHFSKTGTELMDLSGTTNDEDGLTFSTDEFSVYSVVYTVDFVFEIDGKKLEISIEGGNAFSFREAIEKFGIIETDKVDTFIRNIKSVSFSNPEYLWSGKIKESMRLGELKEKYALEVQYSGELKQGNIDAMNIRPLYAPDWVLVSLKPFSTEESLTVEMRSGEKFEIKVTDAQSDAALNPDGSVQTISNPSGTTIDLFDYWIADQYRDTAERDAWPGHYRYPNGPMYDNYYEFDWYDYYGNYQCDWGGGYGYGHDENWRNSHLRGAGNTQGINQGHNFKFNPGVGGTVVDGTKNVPANDGNYGVNSWTKNATPRTGIVQGTLDANGYPIMTNDSNLGTDGTSLDYLFDGSAQTGKEAYTGVNQLLYVDPDGYYTYNSNDFDAQFDKQNKTFTLRGQTAAVGGARGFWPFGNQVYWHGMHVHTDFSMPANGQVLNPKGVYKDMVFEFQGDDDTWLYVDGILVGDGGGIHNQTLIRINFKEGSVLVSGEYDAKEEYRTDYHVEKYLDNLYTAAGKYNDYEWVEARDENGNILYHPNDSSDPRAGQPVMTFASGSNHKFDMYYLERGGGESNLYIHYNLVSTTDFSAHKSYHMLQNDPHARLERDQFKFELIGFDNTDAGAGFEQAIMPVNGTPTGDGTYANPQKTYHEATDDSEGYTSLIIGVTEDGNVNFGNVQVQGSQAGMTYRYMVREVVDDNAVNADGIMWKDATEEQKAEGGFVDSNGVTYDGRVYYFTGTVRETSPGSGQYELKKTRYTDETYTTIDTETKFFSFVNGHVEPVTLKVLKKSDSDSQRLLSGAKFSLVHAKHELVYNDEGNISSEKWIPRTEAEVKTGTTSNGELTFSNLTEGHYILEETAAPQGYARNETYRWLLTLEKQDSENEIKLVPYITPLDTEGTPAGTAELHDVDVNHVVEHEVLNEKLPRGPLTVEKKWLKPDGETEYTPEELAELGNVVQNTQITGELWRRADAEEVSSPTVSIYSKLNNESGYQLRWQEQVESGSEVQFSMAVNGTGFPINEAYTTDTGDVVARAGEQDIYYDYNSGNQIHKTKGHVYSLNNITHNVSIFGEFDSSKASNQNDPRIGFKLISYTPPTGTGQQTIDQKVGDFVLDNNHNWKVTWTSEQLNEDDYDYEYYLKNVSEPELEEFIFISDPEITTETATGSVTYAVRNIKEGPMTDLTVRKVWGDNIDHSDDTIRYKIQRAEYNANGGVVKEAADYIEAGKTSAEIYTLSADDIYEGVSWQRHHDKLPANNGKEEDDPDYRVYKYSVIEISSVNDYTPSYLTMTEPGENPYEVLVIKNNPTDARVSVEKKWMDNGKTSEITTGIPTGAYITGILKKSYTWQEAAGTSVRVYNRLWADGNILSTTLYRTYDVQLNSDFKLWAIDSNGNEPLNGVQANDRPVSQNGEQRTYSMGNWSKATKAFVYHVNGATDIILDWAYNTGFQNGWHYDVEYTQASGGGQSHNETETVGTFRIDASNDWTWVWTDRELDQDHVYTYFFEDVQEHTADGTVVANFDGFKPPEVGSLIQGTDGRWTCSIINEQEYLETGITLKKVNIDDINKENLVDTDLLIGAKFKLEKYTSLQPAAKDEEWNNVHSAETAGDGNGTFSFENLPVGFYKIVETAYPDGYSKMKADPIIEIRKVAGQSRLEVIQVDESGNPITDTSGEMIRIVPNHSTAPTTIVVGNEPGIVLPSTGGPGTKCFTILGSILIAGTCGTLLARRKRKGVIS